MILRPIELFGLDVGGSRPMLMLFIAALGLSIFEWMWHGRMAVKAINMWLLAGFIAAIALSMIFSGWPGGAPIALFDFSRAAGLFVLAALNLTTLKRIKAVGFIFVVAVLTQASLGIYAYHTGKFMDETIIFQRTWSDGKQGVLPERFRGLPPESLQSLGIKERKEKEEELRLREERANPHTITHNRPHIVPAQEDSGWFIWRIRGVGFFNDPNDLAQAIILAIPLLWLLHGSGAYFRNLLFVWLPAVTFLYAVILTNSRGALIGLGSLVFFGLREILGTVRTLIATGMVGAVALLGVVGGSRGFTTGDQSANERISMWGSGIEMLKSYPLFGVGYGRFTEHEYLTAHNSFVLAFSELGLFGFFFWIALLTISYRSLNQTINDSGVGTEAYQTASMIRAGLTGYLMCGWFLSRTYEPILFLTLALAVTCWYCWKESTVAADKDFDEPSWFGETLLMMFVSFVMVYISIRASRLF